MKKNLNNLWWAGEMLEDAELHVSLGAGKLALLVADGVSWAEKFANEVQDSGRVYNITTRSETVL